MVSQKSLPLVVIGLPVFNEAQHVSKALNSILGQTYKNIRLYISDNCSDDGTGDICKNYAKNDSRVKYFRNSNNIGAAPNFKRVVQLASDEPCKYLMFAKGNGVLSPNLVRACVQALEQHTQAVLAFATTNWIDHNDNIIVDKQVGYIDTRNADVVVRAALAFWDNWHHSYGLIRFSALLKSRYALEIIASGVVWLLELAIMGSFIHIPSEKFYRRYKYSGETYRKRMARYKRHTYPNMRKIDRILPFARMPFHLFVSVKKSDVSAINKILILLVVLFNAPLRFIASRGKQVGIS